MNINEPVESESLIKHFSAKMENEEAKKVIIHICLVKFQYIVKIS